MQTQDWILVGLAFLMCCVSFYLLMRDQNEKSKYMVVYSVISTVVVIGITVALIFIYEENTFVFNLKRVCLMSFLWAVAYIDFKEYRIPNTFIILGFLYRGLLVLPELLFDELLVVNLISESIAMIALLLAISTHKLERIPNNEMDFYKRMEWVLPKRRKIRRKNKS